MDVITMHTEGHLNQYVADAAEESTYLEFKDGGIFKMKDEDVKDEIAKDVSAFANADGGVLIYGMAEKDHKATKIAPFDGNIFTKEWLEQIINGRIKRQIPGFIVDPIRIGGNVDQSVYVVRIPRSIHAPHQTSKLEYWKRQNFQNRRMEEYEIREAYFRISQTKLVILDPVVRGQVSQSSERRVTSYDITVDLAVQNIGNTLEKYFKLIVAIPAGISLGGYGVNPIAKMFSHSKDGWNYYSIPNQSPLFQNEQTTMATVYLQIMEKSFPFVEKGIKAQLLYTNGSSVTLVPFLNLTHNDGRGAEHTLTIDCFKDNRR